MEVVVIVNGGGDVAIGGGFLSYTTIITMTVSWIIQDTCYGGGDVAIGGGGGGGRRESGVKIFQVHFNMTKH